MLKRSKIVFFTLLCLFLFSLSVYGEVSSTTQGIGVVSNSPIVSAPLTLPANIEIRELDNPIGASISKTFGLYDGDVLLFDVSSSEFKTFLNHLTNSVVSDTLSGFDLLSISDVTLDHIRLNVWGSFLNKYYGKSVSNFPLGDIIIKFDSYNINIKNTELSKKFILEHITPTIISAIESVSKNYPVKRYALGIEEGMLLKDYEYDISKVREIDSILPFDGLNSYSIYNVGSYFGFLLGSDYVSVLRGYIEGDELGYDKPVKGKYPGCVNVLSYITLLKNIDGNTLSDKVLSDFMIYNNLAIRLDTKELIDTSDMTTNNKVLSFSDYKLDPNILLLTPISNETVIVQPLYLECFYFNGVNKGLGRMIDVTPLVTNNDPTFTVTVNGQIETIPSSYFSDSKSRLDVQLGQSPFLIYYSSHVPYDRMLYWAFNQADNSFKSSDERDVFVNSIKKELTEAGRAADYKSYMKAAGQFTGFLNISGIFLVLFILLVLIILSTFIILIILKKKKKNLEVSTYSDSNLLFESNSDVDDDDENDDNFNGGFELK